MNHRSQTIPTVHPVVIVLSLLTIGALLIWSYRTGFHEPPRWVAMLVFFVVLAACVQSLNRSRSRK
jgi:hypothetical protein